MSAELTREEIARYSRHLIMPEVTIAGQRRLKQGSVLLVGAGGLGSPAALYLAAAGVGRIGILDFDVVDESNLQRQIIHTTDRLGMLKAESAKTAINALNPEVTVNVHAMRVNRDNVLDLIADYDVIVDGADNFPTRYLLSDAALMARKPLVHASILRFEGHASVFLPYDGPCYRCLFPEPPPPDMAPSCGEAGVLGVLCGVMGNIQANEAIKVLLGIGDTLSGRLMVYDALGMTFTELKVRRDPNCPACSPDATLEFRDYDAWCAGIRHDEPLAAGIRA
jgi:adenylyltransferase/sulfurtransferase